jgi:hypothetical protein
MIMTSPVAVRITRGARGAKVAVPDVPSPYDGGSGSSENTRAPIMSGPARFRAKTERLVPTDGMRPATEVSEWKILQYEILT